MSRTENVRTGQDEQLLVLKDRIFDIRHADDVPETYRDYFRELSEYLLETMRICAHADILDERSLEECERDHKVLCACMRPENYSESYVNPAYAAARFGEETGRALAFFASELEACTGYAFEGDEVMLAAMADLYLRVYESFADERADSARCAHREICHYFYNHSGALIERSLRGMLCPEEDFFIDIIMHADLSDARYLYRYGLPVGENEKGIARFLCDMPESKIKAMADTFTEGYRLGFETTGKDIRKKKTVQIYYQIGFERVIREAVINFRAMGLSATARREPVSSFDGKGSGKRDVYSTSINPCRDFDHREDRALWMDEACVEKMLAQTEKILERYRDRAAVYGGPAALEVFGDMPPVLKQKKEAAHYSDSQRGLLLKYASSVGSITRRYIRGDERSYTIIAYPVPSIGPDFPQIFAETVRINTLDSEHYRRMQGSIIDVLDTAAYVRILGRGDNRTNLTVMIHTPEDGTRQTAFENCVADVNIPVGEVFTTPVLKGTSGSLHVSEVFLRNLKFTDLEVKFCDGMVTEYSCADFESEEENRRYFCDHVMMCHKTLPMGEFAIGTNTLAYRMAQRYGIADRLPILIAEKTGPHFALGDSCYSHAEDIAVYNPDGKEIIARDNEISILRRTEPERAYFNCHTDITLPFDEIASVTAVCADGSETDIIRDGLFCVDGTQELNRPLMSR